MSLLSLIPVKDYLWAAAVAALLVGFGVYTHHERALGRAQIEAADAAATLKVTREADARIVALNEDYKSQLQTTEATYEKMHNAGVANADALARSLHTYQNHRCQNTVLSGTAAPSGSDGAAPVAGSDAAIAERTRQLIEAAAADAAQLRALQAERNSLTGK